MEDFVPYKKWLHLHDDEIRAGFPDRPTEALAGETGLNYYTVSRKATRMGVGKSAAFMHASWKKGSNRKGGWKDGVTRARNREAADAYMREHFADTRNADLAVHLGVDVKTVRRWARRLGLTKCDGFMEAARARGCCGTRKAYYTPEQEAWRRRRVEEVWPDGDGAALQALAEELGVSMWGLRNLVNRYGVHRSKESKEKAVRRRAAARTKHGPEVIAALREYYPDHTTAECTERFGIRPGVVSQLAIKYKIRKSREHISRVRSMPRRKRG